MLRFRIQNTPNPKARKYITSEELKAEGKVSYRSIEECRHVPLAVLLLELRGVNQIHFFENVLTITQDGSIDWVLLDQAIQDTVSQNILEHDIFFVDHPSSEANKQKKKELSGDLLLIDNILEETIRPSLRMDGGDVELISFEDDILTIKYQGACNDCPSSMSMTLGAIQNILTEKFRETIQVVVV